MGWGGGDVVNFNKRTRSNTKHLARTPVSDCYSLVRHNHIKNPSHLTLILTFFQMNPDEENNTAPMNVDESPNEINRRAVIKLLEADIEAEEVIGMLRYQQTK